MAPLEGFVLAARTDTDATANAMQSSAARVIGAWFWLHIFGAHLNVVPENVCTVREHWSANDDGEELLLRMNEVAYAIL